MKLFTVWLRYIGSEIPLKTNIVFQFTFFCVNFNANSKMNFFKSKGSMSVFINRVTSQFTLLAILVALGFFGYPIAIAQEKPKEGSLRFVRGEAESFTFDTEVLKGVLRLSGRSIGLFPVTFKADSSAISSGEGFFNHYRVFTRGKRYGYGARRWPSTAELNTDGSVEVLWPAIPDRPFELRAKYKWVAPNAIDLITVVSARAKLEAFEVFLASYFGHTFTDSRVWATSDQCGDLKEGFVSADRELGEWLAFPRDEHAAKVIGDGRWDLEPHPLDWTLMPRYTRPLAIRRDTTSGITVIVMTRHNDCFGIFTPYGEEKHISNYMSLFGYDIEEGETVSARSRLVVLQNPTESEILGIADAFLKDKP